MYSVSHIVHTKHKLSRGHFGCGSVCRLRQRLFVCCRTWISHRTHPMDRCMRKEGRHLKSALHISCLQPHEEFIVCAAIDVPQLNKHADADVQLAGFILGVGRAPDIAAASLQFSADCIPKTNGMLYLLEFHGESDAETESHTDAEATPFLLTRSDLLRDGRYLRNNRDLAVHTAIHNP